jgi:hypothetical protein
VTNSEQRKQLAILIEKVHFLKPEERAYLKQNIPTLPDLAIADLLARISEEENKFNKYLHIALQSDQKGEHNKQLVEIIGKNISRAVKVEEKVITEKHAGELLSSLKQIK